MNKLENRLTGLSTRRKWLLKHFERLVHFLTELQRDKPVECTLNHSLEISEDAKPCFQVNNISGSLLRSVFLTGGGSEDYLESSLAISNLYSSHIEFIKLSVVHISS
jgi:hypothetical protein